MEDILTVFIVLIELVAGMIGFGVGYWAGRKDKILGVLVDERGP